MVGSRHVLFPLLSFLCALLTLFVLSESAPKDVHVDSVSVHYRYSAGLCSADESGQDGSLRPGSPVAPLVIVFLPWCSGAFPVKFSLPGVLQT